MHERDPRRRQDPPRRHLGRSADPRDSGDFVIGRDGKPLVDRYGRPVRRRPQQRTPQRPEPQRSERSPQRPPRREGQRPARREATPAAPTARPQQYVPPRREEPQYRPTPASYQVPTGRRRQAATPRRKKHTLGPLRILGSLLAIVLVLALSLMLWADAQLNRVEALPEQRVANTAGTNWLLVGSDSRVGLSEEEAARLGTGGDVGAGRTDTIMLLHIPTVGEARLVSLPRDSYVTIPGYGDDKINAAFTYGGPQLLTETVENATGLRIDHYAEIGMGGLANVVDAIGGVELCPTEAINDPLANLDIQAGCQKMDGATSLGYVRTRATPMGDLDRVDRQREFFAALMNEATAPNTLLNPLEFFPLVTNTANSFTVGKGDHVWNLARVGLAMRGGVQTETVPVGGFADYAVGNVVLWDLEGAQELWNSMR